MTRFLFSLFLVGLIGIVKQVNAQQAAKITTNGIGYLEHLPPDYATNVSKKYPLIIFLHGSGETGSGSATDLEKVKANGPPKLIQSGSNMCFTVNGVQECFIVISPQLNPNAGGWWPSILQPFFDYVLNGNENYRIDKTRVYLTGLSLGGQGVYIGLGETTDIFAAGAPISAFGNGNGCTISARKIPVWGFHGESDGTIPYSTGLTEFSRIGWCTTPSPTVELKWTSYPGVGHNAWDYAYTIDHSVQSPINLYEWLLTKNKNLSGNASPIANAGVDQTIQLPVNSISLTGNGTDSDGTISSFIWTKIAGPSATLTNATSATVNLAALVAGNYTFRLTVTDNAGTTASDDVNVTVNPAPNTPPTANAGSDQSIFLPLNAINLIGSGADSDGTITSFAWTKVSGSTATLSNANTNVLSVTSLVAGNYIFRLTVTDNAGGTGYDDVNLVVAPSGNLAIGKFALTSSNETASMNGAQAVDGSSSTRWSSKFADPQWMYIDLGSNINVNRVKITWETASAANYEIQTSYDATNWTAIKTITGNTTLTNDLTGLIGNGRYVRMYGTTRKTVYGYSLYEFEVYGTAGGSPPIANAGSDQSITLPINSVNIIGSGTDVDGSISSYAWTQISGNLITLTNSTSNSISLTGLLAGSYTFRLTVTDNSGASSSDDVDITVNPIPNIVPIANAGLDQAITLPTNSITIIGNGTDSDGIISSYTWTQVSGVAASISNPNTSSITLTGLTVGSYVFRLKVIDNSAASSSDDVNITVNPIPNIVPIANAGLDQTITLPTNSITIIGSGTDSDGTISSYTWTQVSGVAASISNPNTSSITLTSLTVGSYVFRLTVIDNSGASSSDDVNITVNPAPVNIALGRPAFTSSNEGWAYTGTQAVDGNSSTRWSSQFSDPQWIYVDLGSSFKLNRVKITWETASASNYVIQTSDDAISWTDIKTVTANTSLINDHIGITGNGRYVRIQGLIRKTVYGYSIYEFEVYGDPYSAQANGRTSVTVSSDTFKAVNHSESEEEPAGLVFLEKTYPGNFDYAVTVYNSNGATIYKGSWDEDSYKNIFREKGFYIYNIFKDGIKVDAGKLYVTTP